MLYMALKALFSGVLVAAISEIGKRFPDIGGLLAALPLVSILAMIWLWRDRPDPANMAAFSLATFWYVIPSLPMFLVIPVMLGRGYGFAAALISGCMLTAALYLALTWFGPRLGIAV